MLAIERRSEILSILQMNQSVLVSDLSKQYNVTEETIRRDLEKLEKEGLVKKTYGGAVLRDGINMDTPLKIRERSNKEEKSVIAKKVAALIEDGDSLMMDSSSTVLGIAKLLKQKKKLTIITNSVEILLEFAESKDVNVISTGGVLRSSSLSLVGPNAERMIKSFNVDKAIISCKGLDLDKGVTESNQYEVELKKAMLASARETILAVDSSKFGKVSFTKLAELSQIHALATDKPPDESYSSILLENKIIIY